MAIAFAFVWMTGDTSPLLAVVVVAGMRGSLNIARLTIALAVVALVLVIAITT